jgi:uncharacterized membrane protein YphA (DoxX/SURF4 family)
LDSDKEDIMRLLKTTEALPLIIIRMMVGGVFLSEGLQKFLFPESVGAGRFARIGFPQAEFVASFVGSFEVLCGVLVLLGLFTRLAVIPLIIIMLTALATTKVPILLESGVWKMAHESRTDFSMLLASIFLLITGSGPYSLDRLLLKRMSDEPTS